MKHARWYNISCMSAGNVWVPPVGSKGATIRILGGGGWNFLEINIFVKKGEINKWPQGLMEKQPMLR